MMFDGLADLFRILLFGAFSAIVLVVALGLALFGLTSAAIFTAAVGVFAALAWTSSID